MFAKADSPDMIRKMHYETRMQEIRERLRFDSEAEDAPNFLQSYWFYTLSRNKVVQKKWEEFAKTANGKKIIETTTDSKRDLVEKSHLELLVMFLPELEYRQFSKNLFPLFSTLENSKVVLDPLLTSLQEFNKRLHEPSEAFLDFSELLGMQLWSMLNNFAGIEVREMEKEHVKENMYTYILSHSDLIREKLNRANLEDFPQLQILKEQILLALRFPSPLRDLEMYQARIKNAAEQKLATELFQKVEHLIKFGIQGDLDKFETLQKLLAQLNSGKVNDKQISQDLFFMVTTANAIIDSWGLQQKNLQQEDKIYKHETSLEEQEFLARQQAFWYDFQKTATGAVDLKTTSAVDLKNIPQFNQVSDESVAEWILKEKKYDQFLKHNYFIQKRAEAILQPKPIHTAGPRMKTSHIKDKHQLVNPLAGMTADQRKKFNVYQAYDNMSLVYTILLFLPDKNACEVFAKDLAELTKNKATINLDDSKSPSFTSRGKA